MKTALALFVMALAGGVALPAQEPWNWDSYRSAMQASGRRVGSFNQRELDSVQQRKLQWLQLLERHLKTDFGSVDPAVLKAFREVPREYFMYNYQSGENFAAKAYETPPSDWAIGYGSVLSDYIIQLYMTALLEPKATDVSLEIGTGSGYQSSILSRIVKKAYTIEIITELGDKVQRIFKPLGYDNVENRIGDGFYGWPEVKGGFDLIVVTCSAPFVPAPLLEQLKPNGRMVVPIGQPWKTQFLYVFTKDAQGKIHSRKDVSVLFIPMTGEIQKAPPEQQRP